MVIGCRLPAVEGAGAATGSIDATGGMVATGVGSCAGSGGVDLGAEEDARRWRLQIEGYRDSSGVACTSLERKLKDVAPSFVVPLS